MLHQKIIAKIIGSIVVIGLLLVIFQLPVTEFVSRIRSNNLHALYQQQYAALDKPLNLLGVTADARDRYHCASVPHGHFDTTINCSYAKVYPPNALLHPLTAAGQQALPATTSQLASLLQANHWQLDPVNSSASSITTIATGHGVSSLDAAYNKRLGSTQCALIATYTYANNSLDANYQCNVDYHYPGLYL